MPPSQTDNLLETVLKKRLPGEPARPFLGAMNFGKRTTEAESRLILARALDLGIVHIDTANAYVDGVSETILFADVDPAVARQKRLVIKPGEFELDPIGGRRAELYGDLAR